MPKSDEQRLEEAVARLGMLTRDIAGSGATRLTIDFQESGELPFRIDVPDETYPVIGLAKVDPSTEDTASTSSPVAESPEAGG
jgi:hypothetical protein